MPGAHRNWQVSNVDIQDALLDTDQMEFCINMDLYRWLC